MQNNNLNSNLTTLGVFLCTEREFISLIKSESVEQGSHRHYIFQQNREYLSIVYTCQDLKIAHFIILGDIPDNRQEIT